MNKLLRFNLNYLPLSLVSQDCVEYGLAQTLFGLIVILFGIGIWACERTARDLGIADHGSMNWDELVAFLLVLLMTPASWAWQAFAFVAFRFFDIVKPPPIRYFERTLKGGLGVMFDDVIAAFYALVLIAVVKQFVG